MVALCNFASRSWELLKKLVLFLTKTSKKLFYKLSGAQVLTDKMASAFEKAMLLSPNSKNGHTILNKFLTGLRLAAAISTSIDKFSFGVRDKTEKQVEQRNIRITWWNIKEIRENKTRINKNNRERKRVGNRNIWWRIFSCQRRLFLNHVLF